MTRQQYITLEQVRDQKRQAGLRCAKHLQAASKASGVERDVEIRDAHHALRDYGLWGSIVTALEQINKPRVEPTSEQIATFEMAIENWRESEATITGEMQEDGEMLVIVENDGARNIAFFDKNGEMIGDWL